MLVPWTGCLRRGKGKQLQFIPGAVWMGGNLGSLLLNEAGVAQPVRLLLVCLTNAQRLRMVVFWNAVVEQTTGPRLLFKILLRAQMIDVQRRAASTL